jgi:hypothetical protein
VFYGAIARGQPFADFSGVVVERPHSAAVSDVAALINDVKTLRPGSVGIIRGVAHVVDTEWQGKLESLRKIIRDDQALLQRFWLRVADVIFFFQVGFHLPFVGGMSLTNVNRQKIGVLFIILVNLNDVADLATEGRSSKATEDQHERPVMRPFTDMESADAVQRDNPRVRRIATHF